ncbi:iron ABC transporter permease [Oscillatoria sp. CS-180]|uniref:ABC transporter permease n=1 Tax=Oscillatoria sp. CS-180 TaxID=3021720 RepID=UPI00232BE36D|nr:iron ABC transporter permease [Oscillatoria sp. CS-180]MDB9526853.1 iron ABC transporter permease [Oscillatoria sp. CS-180]
MSLVKSGNSFHQRHRQPKQVAGWSIVVLAIAFLIASPIIAVLMTAVIHLGDETANEIWGHLVETVLLNYIANSLGLMFGVGFGVLLLGISTAWLVTMCRFPGRRVYEWALLLPLASPAYLLAYTYTDFLEYYGPVQTFLRTTFDWQSATDYWFPNIRSLGGAIVLFSLVLYPYVYMLARVAFQEQSLCALEASRSLGCNPWRSFATVALPLARPAIAAGTALALMETLNDFGTVEYFSVRTFTTGIYRTWFGMGDRLAATQLACILLTFIVVLVTLERVSRRQARYYQAVGSQQSLSTFDLSGVRAIAASLTCALPIALGLLLPAALLLWMALANWQKSFDREFFELASHSFILAGITACLGIALSLALAYGARLQSGKSVQWGVQVASLGYAVPGAVIAVGIMMPIGRLDNAIAALSESLFGISTGLLLSGTVVALIFAYLVRFLAISVSTVQAGLTKIRPTLDDASRSLGNGPTQTLAQVHAPLLSGSLLTAAVLIFVDVMKELPATMVIRPFNFDTLAVRVFQYASDERLVDAAVPAIAILIVGVIPVIFLSYQIARDRPTQKPVSQTTHLSDKTTNRTV